MKYDMFKMPDNLLKHTKPGEKKDLHLLNVGDKTKATVQTSACPTCKHLEKESLITKAYTDGTSRIYILLRKCMIPGQVCSRYEDGIPSGI